MVIILYGHTINRYLYIIINIINYNNIGNDIVIGHLYNNHKLPYNHHKLPYNHH